LTVTSSAKIKGNQTSMELLKLQTDSTIIPGDFFGGVLATSYTPPLSRPRLHSGQSAPIQILLVYGIALGPGQVLAADLALVGKGWTMRSEGSYSLSPATDASRFYRWKKLADKLEIVDVQQGTLIGALRDELYSEGIQRASSDGILKLLSSLFDLIEHGAFGEIDWLLRNVQLDRLAPEFLVGILRSTSHYSARFPYWSTFLNLSREQLIRRGLDADRILSGLGDEAMSGDQPS
jgi:hypothetical protein